MCLGVTPAGTLVRTEGPEPEEMPRFLVAEVAGHVLAHPRHDLPPALCERLGALAPGRALRDQRAVEAILAEHGPCARPWTGTSYVFADPPAAADRLDVVHLGAESRAAIEALRPYMAVLAARRTVFAVVVDGAVVSACVSVREDGRAAEAWVHTDEAHRGRGYARRVTAAWGHDVLSRGKTPFYGHRWENEASRGVARSLGLVRFKETASYP
jgi:hypothetical protein